MTEEFVRISDLPSSESASGLFTVGVDSHGESVKVPIGEMIDGIRTGLSTKFDKNKIDKFTITNDCFAVPSSQAVYMMFQTFAQYIDTKGDRIVCVASESELMALEQQGLLKEGQLYGILEEE